MKEQPDESEEEFANIPEERCRQLREFAKELREEARLQGWDLDDVIEALEEWAAQKRKQRIN